VSTLCLQPVTWKTVAVTLGVGAVLYGGMEYMKKEKELSKLAFVHYTSNTLDNTVATTDHFIKCLFVVLTKNTLGCPSCDLLSSNKVCQVIKHGCPIYGAFGKSVVRVQPNVSTVTQSCLNEKWKTLF